MKAWITWSLRGLVVAAATTGAACTSQEFTIERPDGTVQTYRQIEVHPHLVVRPDQFEVRPAGVTDDGFPVDRITRRDGKGVRVYRVTPPVGEPLFFREVTAPKPARGVASPTETDAPAPGAVERASYASWRARLELSLDTAELEGLGRDGTWVSVACGDVASVTRVAAAAGLLPLEMPGESGTWRVTVDRRFPMATLRLDGALVQVRALP